MSTRFGRTKRRQGRWRDRRQTLPATRRRRRVHRRDTPRGGDYEPVRVEADSARRGVRVRLIAALASLMLSVVCIAVVLAGGSSTFGLVAGLSVGFCAVNAGVALLLSARREESVHMLANEGIRPLLTDGGSPGAETDDGTDGSI